MRDMDDMVPGQRYRLAWSDCCTNGEMVGVFTGKTEVEREAHWHPDDHQYRYNFSDVTIDADGCSVESA